MKKFKNIQWKTHGVIPNALQGVLVLENKMMLSVVAGSHLMSTPGGIGNDVVIENPEDVNSFEVLVFDKTGNVLTKDGLDSPLGWQNKDDINDLIVKLENI
jgi:hypothetical protein|tara:strand:- start:419 stop:721 length:303 start_codon:yes stop_codon:yes gene_type:complete